MADTGLISSNLYGPPKPVRSNSWIGSQNTLHATLDISPSCLQTQNPTTKQLMYLFSGLADKLFWKDFSYWRRSNYKMLKINLYLCFKVGSKIYIRVLKCTLFFYYKKLSIIKGLCILWYHSTLRESHIWSLWKILSTCTAFSEFDQETRTPACWQIFF